MRFFWRKEAKESNRKSVPDCLMTANFGYLMVNWGYQDGAKFQHWCGLFYRYLLICIRYLWENGIRLIGRFVKIWWSLQELQSECLSELRSSLSSERNKENKVCLFRTDHLFSIGDVTSLKCIVHEKADVFSEGKKIEALHAL